MGDDVGCTRGGVRALSFSPDFLLSLFLALSLIPNPVIPPYPPSFLDSSRNVCIPYHFLSRARDIYRLFIIPSLLEPGLQYTLRVPIPSTLATDLSTYSSINTSFSSDVQRTYQRFFSWWSTTCWEHHSSTYNKYIGFWLVGRAAFTYILFVDGHYTSDWIQTNYRYEMPFNAR